MPQILTAGGAASAIRTSTSSGGAGGRIVLAGRGGEVLIGGGDRALGEMRQARDTVLEFGSRVRADGGRGRGGTVVA